MQPDWAHALELEAFLWEGSGVRAVVVTLIFWQPKSLGDKSASGMWLGPLRSDLALKGSLEGLAALPVYLWGW